MGIGFVLLVWAFLLTVLGVPAVAVLLVIAHRTGGRARATRLVRWIAITAPIAVCYAGAWFLVYAFWCSEVRGVDIGIGDLSSVPLGRGFSLTFMDVSDEASIYERHRIDGEALEYDITQIGQSGRYVYGLGKPDSAFVLDIESGALHGVRRQGLRAALQQLGVRDASVEPVSRFYMSRRWGWQDVAALLLLAPLLPFVALGGWRAWRGPDARSRPDAAPLPVPDGHATTDGTFTIEQEFKSILYREGDRVLVFDREPGGEANVTAQAWFPSPKMWREKMPEWARARRREILSRLRAAVPDNEWCVAYAYVDSVREDDLDWDPPGS